MDPPHAQLCAACTKTIQQVCVVERNGSSQLCLADLYASASSCSLCYLTKRAFQDAGYEKDLEPGDDESRRQARTVHFWVRSADVKDDDLPRTCSMQIKYNRNSHDYHCLTFDGFERCVRFSTEPGSPAALSGNIYAGPTITSSGSPEAFVHINSLLSSCIANHAECRKTLGGTPVDDPSQPLPNLPARILDIGDPDTDRSSIRLLEPQPAGSQRGHYAALSCCEAGHRSPTTATPSSALTSTTISVDILPRTFQDAVTATRALGLRYLWIDALCSHAEAAGAAATAAARMGPIFSHARIIFAATAAAAADSDSVNTADPPQSGLFRQYPERPAVTVPCLASASPAAGVMRAELRPREDRVLSPEWAGAALNRCVWATQAYALARRIVFFTAGAVVWRCRRAPRRALWDDGVRDYAAPRTAADWGRIVTEHSVREGAAWGDRLAALGAVVDELALARRRAGREVVCVYGLWTDALATQLMWSRLGAPGSMGRPPELGELAPTWSWASTEGGVDVMAESRDDDGDGPEMLVELAIDDGDDRRIRAKGKLGRVELRVIEKPDAYLHPCDCEVRSEEGEFVGLAASDVGLGEGVTTAVVFCLVLMFHPHNFPKGSYLTLYLQPQEGSDHYVRVGNGMITNRDWADQLAESELYLV